MAQLGHPYAGQVKSSQRRRLRALGAKAGKAWGSSASQHKKKYPKKNAGMEREFTIPGGKGRRRADRLAGGGAVSSRKHRPTHNTNIIISHAGGRGGAGGGGGAPVAAAPRPALPLGGAPVARPPIVPPPVGAMPMGMPMGGGMPMGAPPVRPPLPPPMVGAGAAPPLRPPGMRKGGVVKKRAKGGSADMMDVEDRKGKGYKGFPFSPTSDVDSVTSSRKKGCVTYKRGGRVRGLADGGETPPAGTAGSEDGADKMQFGGGLSGLGGIGGGFGGAGNPQMTGQNPGGVSSLLGAIPGRTPTPPIQGPPNISGRRMFPAQPVTVPMPAQLGSFRAWPAPGTRPGFSKRGGSVKHSDEAEDKKLIKRMMAKEEKKEKAEKRARGGHVGEIGGSDRPGETVLGNPGADFNVGSVPAKSVPKGHKSVLAGEKYKSWGKGKRKDGGTVKDSIQQSRPTGLAGDKYENWGVGYRKAGGTVVPSVGRLEGGSGSGMGRIRKMKQAEKIPDKTEL